jgi:hypothetical protein
MFRGSSVVEQSAVNRSVVSSNLTRGAIKSHDIARFFIFVDFVKVVYWTKGQSAINRSVVSSNLTRGAI